MKFNTLWKAIFALNIIYAQCIDAKVLIITHSYNRPEFIDHQFACFEKFLEDDFEFAVFNDAPTPEMALEIENRCKKWGLSHYRVPQDIHNPGSESQAAFRHGNCIQYSLNILGFDYPGIVMMLDSDMFLIRSFSPETYLQGYDIAGPPLFGRLFSGPEEIGFIRPQIVLMNMNTMPNKKTIDFQRKHINGYEFDTGSATYFYFINNPDVRVRMMRDQFNVVPNCNSSSCYIADVYDVTSIPRESLLYKSSS